MACCGNPVVYSRRQAGSVLVDAGSSPRRRGTRGPGVAVRQVSRFAVAVLGVLLVREHRCGRVLAGAACLAFALYLAIYEVVTINGLLH